MDKLTANLMVEDLSNDFQSEVEKMTVHYVEFEALYEKSQSNEISQNDFLLAILKTRLRTKDFFKINSFLASIAAILVETLPGIYHSSDEV